jgi:hypothetical protein
MPANAPVALPIALTVVAATVVTLAIGPGLAIRLRVGAGIEHPEIVFGVLVVSLGGDAIAGRQGVPGHG